MGILGDFRNSVAEIRAAFTQEQPSHWASELFSEAARAVLRTQEISRALRHADLDEQDMLPDLVAEGLRLQETEVLSATDFSDIHGMMERFVRTAERLDWTNRSLRRTVATALIGLAATAIALVVIAPLVVLFVVTLILGPVLYVVRISRSRGRRGFSAESEKLVHRLLTERVRRTINATLRSQGREEPFHVLSAPSLSELADQDHMVDTPSVRRVARQAETMAYGSLGIAGPRGVGKSALLAGFCDQRFARADSPELRVLISAPVKYDAREFLTHVFARLCEAIIVAATPPLQHGPA